MKVTLFQTFTASNGETYLISVTYDNYSGIPTDAELTVSELTAGGEDYDAYVAGAAVKLGRTSDALALARAFQITLTNPETGEKYQPSKDVEVRITLLNDDLSAYRDVSVVHFPGTADVEAEYGYDPVLYVIYYTEKTTVITFSEETVGEQTSRETAFSYYLLVTEEATKVKKQFLSGDTWMDTDEHLDSVTVPIFETAEPYVLTDGTSNCAILFYSRGSDHPVGNSFTENGVTYRYVTEAPTSVSAQTAVISIRSTIPLST